MCEGKFLVKTLISQNNIIQEVQIENYRCGLRIIKKAPGDWACQDLNSLKKQAKKQRKAGGGESGSLTRSESAVVVEQVYGNRPEAPLEKSRGKISPERSEIGKPGNTLRQLLSSREELKKYFQVGDNGRKEGTREGFPGERYHHDHSTLLSLLRSDSASSAAPLPSSKRRDVSGESREWVKRENFGNEFVVHRNSAITITKLPPPPSRIGESLSRKQSFKVEHGKFRKTGLISRTKKKSQRGAQNKYLSHLLGPSPLLKLQLLNLFVVPLNGENSFPDLLPLKNVSKLKMLFDEDGGKGSGNATNNSTKKEGGDPKRSREEEDDGVEEEVLKKVKVEAEDEDNLIIDENCRLEGAAADIAEDNDSDESFSNQNGIEEEGNGKSSDSSKTGENSGESSNSPAQMDTEDGESKLKAAVKGLSASKLCESLRKEQNNDKGDAEETKNGHDILASKALAVTKSAAGINHNPSKPRNSFVDSCNSNAANSVASSSNCSESGDNTKVLQLEKEIMGLTSLLKSKEREWNALLELKKLKELAVEYYRRQKDVEELFDDDVIQEHEEYLKKLTERINFLSDKVGPDEAQVRTNIQKTEKEMKEGEKKLKIVSVQGKFNGSKDSSNDSGTGDSAHMENFKASLALQQLCERNKTTLAQASSPVQASNAAGPPNKVIGEGRQGAIVEVRSIIADYRSKNPEDSSHGSTAETHRRRPQGQRKQSSGAHQNTSAASNFLSQNRNVSFKDVLVNLAKLSQTEKIVGIPISEPTPTPSPRPSTKNNVSSRQTNSHGADRGQLSSTLAKLLSSNNSVTNLSSSMIQDDSSPMSTLKIDSLSHGGDNSLSLANLLASAKCRDDEVKGDDEELVPICQGCNTNRAQFVCAGCGNQWYCCRECQIQAWEDHSEVCSG